MTVLTVAAPAKVNLYLAVGSRRPDGYHDVVTVMQSLSLADEVVVRRADELALACEPDPCAVPAANLAYRAALAVADAVGREPHVSLSITKRIPAGAGLGGGSADAAAVILGMAELWELDPHGAALPSAAASLGADVPFVLRGGTALLEGRGDKLVRSFPAPRLHLALVNPGTPVSTAEAYAAFDRMPQAVPTPPDTLLAALAEGDGEAVARSLVNNMTGPSSGLVPAIADALAFLRGRKEVLGAEMAGSGSTVFAVCADESGARRVAEAARERGWWAEAVHTTAEGARVVRRESE